MMRNWFILFATTFTITTIVLTITTWLVPFMSPFDSRYIIFQAIASALISLFILLFNHFPIEHIAVQMLIDILSIFIIVYVTGMIINLIPLNFLSFILTLSLVVTMYIIITLIYLFILKKEAEDMNEKISQWRKKHARSESCK